jgi:hypothetical protein
MPATNLNSVPLQLEAVRKRLVFAYGRETTLLDMIKARGDVIDASTRNIRLPQMIRPGGVGGQNSMDFSDMGRGSGSVFEVGTLTTLGFTWAIEVSKLAEYATDSKDKAVQSVPAIEASEAVENFKSFLDALYNTNGTGQFDTISAISGTTVTVTNPDMFQPSMNVLVYATGLASAPRGVATVVWVDPAAGTISLNALPAGTITTDALVVNQNAGNGVANPVSLEGLLYNQVDSTTGTWNNLARSTYPAELKTPHVAAGGAALTPGIRRLMTQKIRRVLMSRFTTEPMIAYWNTDQESAWESNAIQVTENIYQQIKGDESPDMIKKMPAQSFGGIKTMTSLHATKQRVDIIMPGHWGKGVTKEFGPYTEGGQTVFPVYGASGGLEAGYIEYWDTFFNVFMDQPRYGGFIDGLSLPNGY